MANIEALDRNQRLSRQSAMVDRRISELSVLIVGVGGIGSNAAHMLASMGVERITLVDGDTVAEENIYPGFFSAEDASEELKKVDAVTLELSGRYGIEATAVLGTIEEVVDKLDKHYDVVVVGTDSLISRREAWLALRDRATFWLDGRIGGPGLDLYSFDTGARELTGLYGNTLVGEESELPCGLKATAFITKGLLAGFIGETIRDIANREPFPWYRRYDGSDKIFVMIAPDMSNSWPQFLTSYYGGEPSASEERIDEAPF